MKREVIVTKTERRRITSCKECFHRDIKSDTFTIKNFYYCAKEKKGRTIVTSCIPNWCPCI